MIANILFAWSPCFYLSMHLFYSQPLICMCFIKLIHTWRGRKTWKYALKLLDHVVTITVPTLRLFFFFTHSIICAKAKGVSSYRMLSMAVCTREATFWWFFTALDNKQQQLTLPWSIKDAAENYIWNKTFWQQNVMITGRVHVVCKWKVS